MYRSVYGRQAFNRNGTFASADTPPPSTEASSLCMLRNLQHEQISVHATYRAQHELKGSTAVANTSYTTTLISVRLRCYSRCSLPGDNWTICRDAGRRPGSPHVLRYYIDSGQNKPGLRVAGARCACRGAAQDCNVGPILFSRFFRSRSKINDAVSCMCHPSRPNTYNVLRCPELGVNTQPNCGTCSTVRPGSRSRPFTDAASLDQRGVVLG